MISKPPLVSSSRVRVFGSQPLPILGRRRKLRTPNGQTLLEMALLVPIVLVLLIGVIEIGRYTYLGIVVGNAAHAGAEYGIQGTAQAAFGPGIVAAAKNDFQNNGQNPSNLTVTFPASQANFTFASYPACTCVNSSGVYVTQPTTNYCNAPPRGTNNTAGSCPSTQHWVVLVGVEATGTFPSILIPAGSSFLGIPGSITIDRTSILEVAP
jgi:Flp pilus assembly protein TadG